MSNHNKSFLCVYFLPVTSKSLILDWGHNGGYAVGTYLHSGNSRRLRSAGAMQSNLYVWGRFIPLWILKGPLWKVRHEEISSVWKESLVFHSLNKKNVEISLKLPSVWKLIWPGTVSGRVGRWKDNSGKFFSARRNYQAKTQTFHHAVPFLLLCLSDSLSFSLSFAPTHAFRPFREHTQNPKGKWTA